MCDGSRIIMDELVSVSQRENVCEIYDVSRL